MISTSDFKNGMIINLEGELFSLIEFQHVKPGKGGAFVRTKLKSLSTGRVFKKTFRAGEKVEQARLEEKPAEYLYNLQGIYYFLDVETYEQIPLSSESVGESKKFLKENEEVTLLMHNGSPIGLRLPIFVELKVVHAEPGVKGDTAMGADKLAKLETGVTIQVPLFIESGDVVKIDTRTGKYAERV